MLSTIRMHKLNYDAKNHNMNYALYAVCGSMIFLAPLQSFVSFDIHILIVFIGIVWLALTTLRDFKLKIDPPTFFLGVLFLKLLETLVILENPLIACVGFAAYAIPIVFAMLYLSAYRDASDRGRFIAIIIYAGTVMGLFGIYQIFVDPTLFGIMESVYYTNNLTSRTIVSTYRATSFLPSPQVYSLFLLLTMTVLIERHADIPIPRKIKTLCLIVLVLSGLLSGSKLFVWGLVFVAAFVLFKKIMSKRHSFSHRAYVGFFLVLGLIVILCAVVLQGGLFDRFDFVSIVTRGFTIYDTSQQDRFSAYSFLFNSSLTELLFGHGLSTSSYAAAGLLGFDERVTLESYLLSIWYEMGFAGIISFMALVLGSIALSTKIRFGMPLFGFIFLFAAFSAPSLFSFAIFPFWLLLLFPFYPPEKKCFPQGDAHSRSLLRIKGSAINA